MYHSIRTVKTLQVFLIKKSNVLFFLESSRCDKKVLLYYNSQDITSNSNQTIKCIIKQQ